MLGTGYPLETFRARNAHRNAASIRELGPGCEAWLAADAARLQANPRVSGGVRLAFLRAAVAKFAAMLF